MGFGESMGRGFRLLQEALEGGIEFGKRRENFVSVLKYLVVSSLVMVGVGILILLLGVAAYFLLGGLGVWALVPAALIALVLGIGGKVYSHASSLAAIQYIYSGKKRGYFERGNLGIAFRWTLFMVAVVVGIIAIFLLPIAISTLGGGGIAAIFALLLGLAGWLLLIAGLIIYAVFMYYVQQELAVNRRGPIEAIKASVGVVKRNFWETVLFAFVVYFLSQVLMAIPMTVLSFGTQLGISLLMLGGIAGIVLGVVLILLFVLLIMAVAFLVETAELMLKVLFYKKIEGGRGEKKAEAPMAKPVEKKPGEIVIEERVG